VTLALAEIISGILFMSLAGWFLLQAHNFPPPLNAMDVGPAVFPQIIAAAIVLFALALLIQGIKTIPVSKKVSIKRGKYLIGSIALIIGYALVIPFSGYYIATALYIPVLLYFAGTRKWQVISIITVAFIIFAKAGFEILLKVPLP